MNFSHNIRSSKAQYSFAFFFCLLFLFLSVAPASATPGETTYEWSHGDWTSRIVWEARYALSQSANGVSNNSNYNYYPPIWYGDWDYPASDSWALQKAIAEQGGSGWSGDLGPITINGKTYFRSGWCTMFVRLVLFRSTYWAGYGEHLALHYPGVYDINEGEMTRNWSSVQPGWIFIKKPNTGGSEHMAIADQRDYQNGSWGWWFIDANYVGFSISGSPQFIVGRHFMSDQQLNNGQYWGWYPHLANHN